VINVELARIEQQWRVDSDAEKPGKFTKDMTYHSIRKLAKNITGAVCRFKSWSLSEV